MGLTKIESVAADWAGTTALERRLLGAVLRDNAVYPLIRESVDAADFGTSIDQRIYAAIEKRLKAGETAEPSTVGDLDDYGVALDRRTLTRCPFALDDLIEETPMESLMKQLATAMSGARDPTQAR